MKKLIENLNLDKPIKELEGYSLSGKMSPKVKACSMLVDIFSYVLGGAIILAMIALLTYHTTRTLHNKNNLEKEHEYIRADS